MWFAKERALVIVILATGTAGLLNMSPEFNVVEIKNDVVADPVCEGGPVNWTASYKTGQDFHIEVDVPNATPGEVYGLSQTLMLSVRNALYENKDIELIQLWRTPPQQTTKFDFKGAWLDIEDSDPTHPNFPYYNSEAIGTTQLREEKAEGKDTYYVNPRMHKKPQVVLPTQIQKKNNKDEKLTIVQFDVQEMYLITLYRDQDVKSGNPTPLLQWDWAYKYAWTTCNSKNGEPRQETRPGFTRKVRQRHDLIHKYNPQGPSLATDGHHEYFKVLDKDIETIEIGEADEWTTKTDEWEACAA